MNNGLYNEPVNSIRFIIVPMIRYLPILLCALMLLAACAPTGPSTRPDRVEDPELTRIETQLAAQEFVAAAEAYTRLAAQRPDQADLLHIRSAEAWLAAGETDRARSSLMQVDARNLDFAERVRMDLAQAELALLEGDLATAGWLLAHSAERLPSQLVDRHTELDQRLREAQVFPGRAALQALSQAVSEPDFNPELALSLLIEFPLADLEEILFEAGDRPDLLPWLDLVISAREHLLDDELLGGALDSWERRYPETGYSAGQARQWIATWRRSMPQPAMVTVILPNRQSALHRPGIALRDGLMSGWLELAPEHRPELNFIYVDDTPESAVSAWYDARERGSDFLIGPLDRDQVNEMIRVPGAGLLPSLLLNVPDEPERLEQAGAIAAIGLLPEEEAELAAVRALIDGHRRAIVLGQHTSWGERVAEAFSETFTLGGGRILDRRTYEPDIADHSFLLTTVLQIDRSEERIHQLARVLDEPLEAQPQRRTDLDLIFLAARAGDGRQLRPQLRFFDASDVPLMATSQMIAGAPDPDRDRDLDGVIAPMSPWFLDFTPQGQLRRQAEGLYDYLDTPPLSRLHALGRDAISLVPWLDMMRADPALHLPGMTGRLSLPETRVFQRDLPFIRISGGRARPE